MIKQLIERIKKFIKDHIVDEDPCNGCGCDCGDCKCEGCDCECKKSIEDTKKIESTEQKDFEDYLKEFLDKIS